MSLDKISSSLTHLEFNFKIDIKDNNDIMSLKE